MPFALWLLLHILVANMRMPLLLCYYNALFSRFIFYSIIRWYFKFVFLFSLSLLYCVHVAQKAVIISLSFFFNLSACLSTSPFSLILNSQKSFWAKDPFCCLLSPLTGFPWFQRKFSSFLIISCISGRSMVRNNQYNVCNGA